MKYTVVGVADGMRLEMPVEATNVVDAIHAAEAAGLVVTHVQEAIPDPTTRPVNELAPVPVRSDTKPKGDSPVLCAFVGLVIPLIGFLMALLKARKDPTGALACLIGSVVGFLLWGAVFV